MSKRFNRIALVAAGAVVLLSAGCDHTKPQSTKMRNFFAPDSEVRPEARLIETQAAAGARAEGTLYPQHFDGAGLSSLGTARLELMLKDSHSCNPLVVYLAVPTDAFPSERRAAVGNYLKDRGGLTSSQIVFKTGPNPATYYQSAPNLKNYDKTDTGVADTTTAGPMGGGAPAGGAAH